MSTLPDSHRCADPVGHTQQRWAIEQGCIMLSPDAVKLNYAVDAEGVGYWWKVLRCRCIFVAFPFTAEVPA